MTVRSTFITMIVILITTACSSQSTDTQTGSSSQNTLQTPSENIEIEQPDVSSYEHYPQPIAGAIGPETYPDAINPLTGMPLSDPSLRDQRPIVVKISNAPALVRPQAGINAADIVFEHYVEGGLTRFSAVFLSQSPERVGSVRSARLIDHEIVPMLDGALAFSGASIGVEKYIFGSETVNNFYSNIDGIEDVYPGAPQPPSNYVDRAYKGVLIGEPVFWRDADLPIPHNYFVNLSTLRSIARNRNQEIQATVRGLAFHADQVNPVDALGALIDIRYRGTRVLWHYDPETEYYYRTSDGLPHYDALDGSQISAANVVVLFADHSDTLVVEGQYNGNPIWSIQIAIWGQNEAVLFRDGQQINGMWTRTVREDFISLRTNDGELLYLKPGNTWFQVMPSREQMNPGLEWLHAE